MTEDHGSDVSSVPHRADAIGTGDLLDAARRLLLREPGLGAMLSLDVHDLRTDAELLAMVVSGAVPAGPARTTIFEAATSAFGRDAEARRAVLADVRVATRHNFEPGGEVTTLLFARGIHALIAHRVAHAFWADGRTDFALGLKTVFGRAFSTDIHPGARFGAGIWLDHGLGFVVGETAVVEDGVAIWHGVTLGSTLKDAGGARHPRLRRGATIGAGAIILGSVSIGENSVVAAGSVVVGDVAPGTTVAGVPAKAKPRSTASFSGFPSLQAGEDLP